MAELSIDLRRQLVEAYRSKKSGTYAATAALFGVGEATVSRNLRRFRETGDVRYKPKGGNNPRRVDLVWLSQHLKANPDARLIDRIEAWVQQGGKRVGVCAMWVAVRACGWTHKKRQFSPVNASARTFKRSEKRFSPSSQASMRRS
jgi:transposase